MSIEILSPMPGTICQVNVGPGDPVVEGQELLLLEAMKMENPIIATGKGVVKEVLVKEGDMVATKQVLVVIEEE
ncbi:MAG: acetyl-CoA carboxylase biotin carboxyl carrier protein subunit [Desulfobacter sp.]|nr:acetyl-CoA carboxylase biotin carboxyl carrier protein subunit [Desulfobacter sp.]WDP85408.1 MAG: acetyl-CoA carboxylase biotin carboxyl carrier protein subunit [Desulfobacter sp.]